jgi:regulator of protease activity HflC (stomatin/prohibitin superfamily)
MKTTLTGIGFLLVIMVTLIVGCLVGCPRYRVYTQEMEGKAELQRAISNRQIAIQEAHAKMEAAKDLAQAEIIRARGIAKANQIIGNSLKNNEAYLHWLWIDQLENNKNSVIYIPTEANLPIMEANRLRGQIQQPAVKK